DPKYRGASRAQRRHSLIRSAKFGQYPGVSDPGLCSPAVVGAQGNGVNAQLSRAICFCRQPESSLLQDRGNDTVGRSDAPVVLGKGRAHKVEVSPSDRHRLVRALQLDKQGSQIVDSDGEGSIGGIQLSSPDF